MLVGTVIAQAGSCRPMTTLQQEICWGYKETDCGACGCQVMALKQSELSRAVETFHHEPRAAARDVRNDGSSPVDFRDDA